MKRRRQTYTTAGQVNDRPKDTTITVVYKPYWRESSLVMYNDVNSLKLYHEIKGMFSKGSVTCKTKRLRRVRITGISADQHHELVTMLSLASTQAIKSCIRNN